MFIKKLNVINFRCFDDEGTSIDFRLPDGQTRGSGLNILVGSNGVGKTTILECINYLTTDTRYLKDKIGVGDFRESVTGLNEIEISAESTDFSLHRLWGKRTFKCSGFRITAGLRKVNNTRLNDPITISSNVVTDEKVLPAELRHDLSNSFGHSRFEKAFAILYFEKNRQRHLNQGFMAPTKFDDIIDDLNFQFLNTVRKKWADASKEILEVDAKIKRILFDEYKDKVLPETISNVEELLGKSTENISLGFFSLLQPFSNAFLSIKNNDTLQQIPVNKLGSGIEMIYSLFFLLNYYSHQYPNAEFILLIDEPEISLNPQIQRKFFDKLQELSAIMQVIITTHSPHFVSPDILDSIIKIDKSSNGVTVKSSSGTNLQASVKNERNFFLKHRDLFFTNKAFFIEGMDDEIRYRKYCDRVGIDGLFEHSYTMNGCDHTFLFSEFCAKYDIKFVALVDSDFAFKRSIWTRANRRKMVSQFVELLNDNNIDFNRNEVYRLISKELESTAEPKGGKYEIDLLEIDGTQIQQIKDKNIYVLKYGEVKDYLNDNGEVDGERSAEKEAELNAIFQTISKYLNDAS